VDGGLPTLVLGVDSAGGRTPQRAAASRFARAPVKTVRQVRLEKRRRSAASRSGGSYANLRSPRRDRSAHPGQLSGRPYRAGKASAQALPPQAGERGGYGRRVSDPSETHPAPVAARLRGSFL